MKLDEVAFDYDAVENESLLYQIVKDILQSGKGLYIDADFPHMMGAMGGGKSKAQGRVISVTRTGSHVHWKMTVNVWGDVDKTFVFELAKFDDEFTIEQRNGKSTLVNV
jgi:hypothetical protein